MARFQKLPYRTAGKHGIHCYGYSPFHATSSKLESRYGMPSATSETHILVYGVGREIQDSGEFLEYDLACHSSHRRAKISPNSGDVDQKKIPSQERT